MQVDVKINALFSYSIIPLIVVLLLFVILFLIYIVNRKKNKIQHEMIKPKVITPEKKENIKTKYLNELKLLENSINAKSITNREAYLKLSKIIRSFVFEMTNIKVHKYTLNDIANLNIKDLYELVKEFYEPEFAKLSMGDIQNSISKTRQVILQWH